MNSNFLQIIKKKYPKLKYSKIENMNCIFVGNPLEIEDFLKFLKEDKSLRFTMLTDLFAADFPNRLKRFEIIYNLLSLEMNERIIVKTMIGEEQLIPSVHNVFSACVWYQREIFDMFGVKFDESPDDRRILTDYGFVGHPLRKDFPLSGHLQVKYDEELGKVVYEQVNLDQDYRNFDFASPWTGPNESGKVNVLPGDEKATK